METRDIFTTITRYNKPENRFTASLVYLIRYLWNNSNNSAEQRKVLCRFLKKFCEASFTPDARINIEMLKTEKDENEDKKIPDFQIDSGSILVWVEVKDEAPLEDKQLENYKNKLLKKKDYEQKNLVLLRHYYVSKEETEGVVDVDVTWSRLYALLKEVGVSKVFNRHRVHSYLLRQFLKYLAEKGEIVVERIDGKCFKTGFSQSVSLLRLVKAEAEQMFQENNLQLNVSKTDINFQDTDFIEFNFDEGNNKGNGYFVGLWGAEKGYPFGSVVLKTKSENVEKIEEKEIMLDKVPNNSNFFSDEEGFVYVRRPLKSVFAKSTVEDQSQEIGRLLREMYNELGNAKKRVPQRRRRKGKGNK